MEPVTCHIHPVLGGSSHKWVITCYNPSYKWINPTYPIYNWGYNPLTKWDEPPSKNIEKTGVPPPQPAVLLRILCQVPIQKRWAPRGDQQDWNLPSGKLT